MSRRILLINIILIIFVIAEIFSMIQLWSSDGSVSELVNKSSVKPLKFKAVRLSQGRGRPVSAYNDIIQKNLFSSERKEYIPEVVEPEPESKSEPEPKDEIKELNTNKIILYGIIIMEDFKKALVTDVDNMSKSNSIWLEKGDSVDKFMIESIEKDRLIVTKSGKNFFILLYDKKKPKKRKFVQKKVAPKKKVITTPPVKPVRPGKSGKPSVSLKKDDEYDIISTPFGDFKRKKKR